MAARKPARSECDRFDAGDVPYLHWLVDHPYGFVVNARRNAEQGDMVVHAAACPHIRSLRNTRGAEGFTTGSWIKFCGTDLSSLLRTALASRKTPNAIIRRCKGCEATALDIHLERYPGEHLWSEAQHSEHIVVNARERDPLNRALCFIRHGMACAVCNIDLVQRYGALAEGFIEAHEVHRQVERGMSIEFDPARDLVPVCPTCHAMLHRGRALPLAVEDLRKAMRHALHQQLGLHG
jgi:hypothetical protein